MAAIMAHEAHTQPEEARFVKKIWFGFDLFLGYSNSESNS